MSYIPLDYIMSKVSANTQSTQSNMINGSGSILQALTPVYVKSDGEIDTIDVSLESTVMSIVGITSSTISIGATGLITTQGRITDVPSPFLVGDYVYVSKTGNLTNVLPTVGIDGFMSGDFIIRVGVIAKNETNPANKDIFVNFSIVGQL